MNRPMAAWIVGMVLLGVVLWLVVPRPAMPYAVDSTAPDGTDILRRVVVDEFDREVVQGPSVEVLADLQPSDVVLVVDDRLSEDEEATLAAHAHEGGRVVVADPRMDLVGGATMLAGRGFEGRADCDLLPSDPQVELERDATGRVTPETALDVFEPPAGTVEACWQDGDTAFVAAVEGPDGGMVVALGDPDALTNAAFQLDLGLAQLLVLVVPWDDDGRLLLPIGNEAPPMATRPIGALPDDLRTGMWVAAVAAVVYALGRARRHGRVLAEPPLVEVASSELAVGVAELLQRHGRTAHAADRLRADLRAEAARAVTAGDEHGESLVTVTTAATGLARDVVHAALIDDPVATAEELTRVVEATAQVRRALGLVAEPAKDPLVETARALAEPTSDTDTPSGSP